jgi:hypothetical protein
MMGEPNAEPPPPAAGQWSSRLALRTLGVAVARARFLILVGGFLAVVAFWPLARNYWDKFTRTPPAAAAVSPDTEYWCPMCPGVVSEWPGKCPVCSMTLVRRQKGEMTPLPDGVVARVQLSPYRVQLAGIRTAPVEFRPLEYEVTAAGLLEAPAGSTLTLTGEVFERNALMLSVGQEGSVTCDACPGESVPGRIVELTPPTTSAVGWRVRTRVENPHGELHPGQYAAAKFHTPASRLDAARRVEAERWRDQVAAAVLTDPLGSGPAPALLEAGVRQAVARTGLVLSVPEAAVIDTGSRQLVYIESMPGMFDAVEVRLGRRCGDYYPVWSGVDAGQRVAAAGAVLLDAETRLNPNVATSYFGAGQRASASPSQQAPAAPTSPGLDDKQLIARQKICPVSEQALDSMGDPVRLVVDGRVVFICCKGCEKDLRDPRKTSLYLKKLPK